MEYQTWREATLEKLTQILQPANQVLSLSLFGSLSNPEIAKDKWSDIDALLIVADEALDKYFPSIDWLKPLGKIFALQQSSNKQSQCSKVIFSDFKKIDLVISTRSKLIAGKPFWTKQKFVFSNSPEAKQIMQEKALPSIPDNPNDYDLKKLSDQFWFISFVVVTKVIRNDLLIALHLALDLYRNCLLLGMWQRDRETGTYIHRTGGAKNTLLVKEMDIKIEDLSKKGVLLLVEKCRQEFDKLALEWDPDYTPHLPIFKKVLEMAEEEI